MFLIVYKQEISCHKVSHCSSSLFTAFSCCQASHSSLWLLNAAVILKRHYQQKQSQKFVITLVLNYLPLEVSLSRTSTNAQHCCFITVWLSQNKTSSWLFLKVSSLIFRLQFFISVPLCLHVCSLCISFHYHYFWGSESRFIQSSRCLFIHGTCSITWVNKLEEKVRL